MLLRTHFRTIQFAQRRVATKVNKSPITDDEIQIQSRFLIMRKHMYGERLEFILMQWQIQIFSQRCIATNGILLIIGSRVNLRRREQTGLIVGLFTFKAENSKSFLQRSLLILERTIFNFPSTMSSLFASPKLCPP